MCLTNEELTKARILSSPEIPDDDDTAKQPTRQLVRKMLAHIDEVTQDAAHMAATQCLTPCGMPNGDFGCVRVNQLQAELHAALDAKEKAEATMHEISALHAVEVTRREKAEALLEKSQSNCRAVEEVCMERTIAAEARCAELQAIVDRLPKTADGSPIFVGMELWIQSLSDPQIVVGCGSMFLETMTGMIERFKHTYSTREAAISAAASSGAKGGVK